MTKKKTLKKPVKKSNYKFIAYSIGNECRSNTSYIC